MQVIIELNAEAARQLDALQNHTNQDRESVIEQGIGLYYQQLQPHREFYIETKRQYELTCNVSASTSSN
jgi:predicted transcriptional regulator